MLFCSSLSEKISNLPFAVQGVLAASEIVLTPVEVQALEDVGVLVNPPPLRVGRDSSGSHFGNCTSAAKKKSLISFSQLFGLELIDRLSSCSPISYLVGNATTNDRVSSFLQLL